MVKCVPTVKRKFKSSKNQMKDLLKSSKRKKTDKNQKRNHVSKSRGLKSRETRVQKPKKEIKPKTFKKINRLTKIKNKYYLKR
jgi:hypothetical protein